MNYPQTVLSASTISDENVKNAQGDDLGQIKDIMIDVESGRVEYYVLSFGGFLGMGDKLFAVPPQAFTLNTKDKYMVLNVSKEQLEEAPGFDKDNWPNMADETFRNQIYGFYGYKYRQYS